MRRLVAVALLAIACAKPAPPPKKIIEEKPPDPKEEARAVLKSVYSALEVAEPELLAELLGADAMVFGLGPSETFNFRDPLIERLKQELMPLGLRGDTLRVAESDIRVGLADGGRSAWLFDLPKVIFEHKGEATIWLPRITAHAVLDETRWRIDALHVSLPVSDTVFYAPESLKRFLPPAEVANERGPDSDQVIGVARRMQDDPGVKIDRVSSRGDVFLLGTSSSDVYPGSFFRDLKPRVAELRRGYIAPKFDGPQRARLGPGGKSGWVAGAVLLRAPNGKKLPALRALWIFTEEKGFWNLVSEHLSVPLKVEQREPASKEDLAARKPLAAEAPKKGVKKVEDDADGGTGTW